MYYETAVTPEYIMKAVFVIFMILPYGCSSPGILDSEKIFRELKSARVDLGIDKKNIDAINSRKAGKTGFYYIINRDGMVVYHPVTMLIGSNFKKYKFLEDVLKSRSGCFQYTFGENIHLIFFDSLNENDILCLSIPGDEVQGTEKFCKPINENKSD
jgi:hypothetical protein